jgi:hypothetical protein
MSRIRVRRLGEEELLDAMVILLSWLLFAFWRVCLCHRADMTVVIS